ncbi:MAG: PolC-type DNA polymerase III [Erysipelotrichaceae bacterium]
MSINLEEIINKLNLEESSLEYMKTGSYKIEPCFHNVSQWLEVEVEVDNVLPYDVYYELKCKLMKKIRTKIELKIKSKNECKDISIINKYVINYVEDNLRCSVFKETLPTLENKYLVYRYSDEAKKDNAIQNAHFIEDYLGEVGIQLKITTEDYIKNVEPVKIVERPVNNENVSRSYDDKKEGFVNKKKKNYNDYMYYPIKDIVEACYSVKIIGKVFNTETKTLKSGKNIQTIWIADEDDALIMKRFERGNVTLEVLESLHIGDYIACYGNVEYDTYIRDLVLKVDLIEVKEEKIRLDNADTKRVELHTHTKLSEMDGVSDVVEYIKTAAKWGHKAIAVTDHIVVQSFPKAQHAVEAINAKRDKDDQFKMIYGLEMNMVDPVLKIVRNATDIALEEGTYCIFDLETTGLSPRFDHIIEFGAQIMQNRDIKKSLQLFIKPPVQLSAFTMGLTHITQAQVDSAQPIEDCIDQILEFIGDNILVAHNATFDYGFLNQTLKRLGRKPLMNPVVDTLHLSWSLHSERKGHKLGNLAKMYGVNYESGNGAHRADYDAEVLAQVYMNMLNELKEIKTLKDLANMQDSSCFNKVYTKHITVLAKNAAGLKEMFELVTLSHIKYLSYNAKSTSNNIVAEPRIIREEITKRHANGNLLLGTSCTKGEVFDIACTGSEEELIETLKYYDYVEIQPLECYKHLIDVNSIVDEKRLKEIVMSIIDAAKSLNKMIVASGDCHYVNPEQKLIRDIYICSQAIGGKRHPLYIRDDELRKNTEAPDQHLLTTDEMLKAFEYLGEKDAYEIVVENTNKIADMIESIFPVKDRLYPPDIEGSDEKLRELCKVNAHKTYGEQLPEIVEKRLNRELDSIIGHGFYVVYYISHLLVKKSMSEGYLVGSRGSVGSSFVATMSEITEVNPLAPHYVCPKCHYTKFFEDGSVADGYDLPDIACPNCGETIRGDGHDIPFETFLGFEGDKVPDIDLNFSSECQPHAHAYTKEVFGEDHVFKAGTIGTVATQTAYGYVKGYEEQMGIEGSMRNAQILRLATGCEGVKRTTGQHPGGVIVIPLDMDVHDFTPVQYPANNPFSEWKTTHFEFHDIHDNVLKFDILGHVDPTAMKMLERMSGIDVTTIPMNDIETMSLFSSIKALNIPEGKSDEKTGAAGLPEFGTPFVRGILELTKPTTFAELLKISGLSHGTDVWLGNAKDLIDNGTCTLSSVIGCRDDIMVYLLHKNLKPKLAFTIMESVRKGKGLKEEWITDMKACGVEDWYIESCLKIKYMFPKAHAVAYVMMAIRIAWFKVHKPEYYYCMYFSIRCDAYDIVAMIQGEASIKKRMNEIKTKMDSNDYTVEVSKKEKDTYVCLELALEMVLRGINFGNIDIMKSDASNFIVSLDNPHVILPPFASIDGLGSNVADTIVEARKNGAFLSKQDICNRTGLSSTSILKLDELGVLAGFQEENQLSLF